jgi:hypothetical protein
LVAASLGRPASRQAGHLFAALQRGRLVKAGDVMRRRPGITHDLYDCSSDME